MSEAWRRWSLILKTAAFLLAVPGTVAGLMPYALVRYCPVDMPLDLGAWRFAGVLMMLIGAAVYGRCSFNFALFGRGIPSPTSPTQFLVRNGLYRHMRNPMYAAGSLFLFGEAIALQRGILFVYAAAVTLCYHPAVVFLEEPALRKRFGQSYERYCAQVPRWLPRFRGTELPEEQK
jgi:protein-S-isoprenylcysteine O-methyltransferase Ste14